MEQQRGEARVTALIAESDRAQRYNISLYAQYQDRVRLLGAVPNGDALLAALRQGPCPDVLVMDALLQGTDLFGLLGQISRFGLPGRPAMLLTASVLSEGTRQKLLTLGVDYIILKPYHLGELFQAVELLGARPGALPQKQLSRHVGWHMEALRANFGFKGESYIAAALRQFAPLTRSVEAEEIYQWVAQQETVEKSSVKSAIQRAIRRMRDQGTEEYRAICRYYGRPETELLSNADFLFRLLQLIRQELCL